MDRIAVAEHIATQAGELLLKLFKKRLELSSQTKGQQDIVTRADTETEELIEQELSKAFPGEKLISEEVDLEKEHSDVQYVNTWFIDPLDGTRNFSSDEGA